MTKGKTVDALTAAEIYKDIGIAGVLLIVAIVLVYKLYPFFVEYLQSAKRAKDERAKADVSRAQAEHERNEIMRMSNSVIDNNTAALQTVSMDREMLLLMLERHENASQERDLRNEGQNAEILAQVGKARGDIGKIKVIVGEKGA